MPGIVQVDDVDGQAEEPVDDAHPLGVTLGQVGVHRDQVRPAPRQGVQVQGHGGDQGLPFTGGHLGDLPLVQRDSADELHVVGDHVPDQLLARDHDLLAHEPPTGLLHHGEGLGKEVVQGLLDALQKLLVQPTDLLGQDLPDAGDPPTSASPPGDPRSPLPDSRVCSLMPVSELLGFPLQLLVRKGGKALEGPIDLGHEWARASSLPWRAVTPGSSSEMLS